jgi:phage terminase Nu1 subunit (DNA packaging protein)
MATIAEAAAHIFLTAARFHELVSQGVITKAERGAYDLDKVREEYIRNIRKKATGHGTDAAGLSEARAELTREQTQAVAMKNAITRGDFVPLAVVRRNLETVLTTVRERVLSIPGKTSSACEMRSRGEIEEIMRGELHEALDELRRPIIPEHGGSDLATGDSAGDEPSAAGFEAAAEPFAG